MLFTEKQKSQLLIIGFVGAVMMVICIYFHFMIVRARVSDYTGQSKKLEKLIAETTLQVNEIRELMDNQEELEEQRETIQQIVRRLPSTPQAPGFLMELGSVLRKTGIFHEMVKPEKPTSNSQYTELPYNIEAHGRYHEIGQLLTLIEQNPQRFMRVKNFTIENNFERPSVHPISLEIATFMLKN